MEEKKRCEDCQFFWDGPALDEPVCRRGVTYGRHHVPAPCVSTMRHDHWWGSAGCGADGKLWEPRQ